MSRTLVETATPMRTGAPANGLPYRLFVSGQATPEHPHRLVVWLHPTGTDGLTLVEPLADAFAAQGFALLTLPREHAEGWNGTDANRMMLGTLPEVARVPGVDADRPVLLGFSAGAQMALELWAARPAAFRALVLVAGAPRLSRGDEHTPPQTSAHARVPILSFIGETDGSAPLWRTALESWRAAGLRLDLHEVLGQGHTWLLALPAEQAALFQLLAELSRAP
ncbi:alpha/beta hydrolase [Corallococcus exercitus]|uniref:alpha/beta hydrolase n=1 Tax=Corallococcus exercitus TaxID=2316736 RepID=UPI0035D466DA